MEASELRPSNLIQCEGKTLEVIWVAKTGEISASDENGFVYQNYQDQLDKSNIEPIPLTEELFLTLKPTINKLDGDNKMMFCYLLHGIEFVFNISGKLIYNRPGGFEHTIKYLHQLQNLVFALTGAELEWKR